MKPLGNIDENQKEHLMQCPDCEQWFDMRRLNEVLSHEHYLQAIPVMNYSYSVKAGKPALYFKNHVPIIIN